MLPKAHVTSHSRMPGSGWVITPLWLSGSWRFLLYSSVYSCYLILICSAFDMSIPFLSFIVPFFAWNDPLVSLVFLNRSLVFLVLLCFPLICLHWSLRKAFLSLLAILWNSALKWVCLSFSPLPFSPVQFSHSVVSDSLHPRVATRQASPSVTDSGVHSGSTSFSSFLSFL